MKRTLRIIGQVVVELARVAWFLLRGLGHGARWSITPLPRSAGWVGLLRIIRAVCIWTAILLAVGGLGYFLAARWDEISVLGTVVLGLLLYTATQITLKLPRRGKRAPQQAHPVNVANQTRIQDDDVVAPPWNSGSGVPE
jgi:uncharacterized membrane protein